MRNNWQKFSCLLLGSVLLYGCSSEEDVIKMADRILDMGPEGGNGGGTVVAYGTPEQVAKVPESHTGRFLAPILERDRARQAKAID